MGHRLLMWCKENETSLTWHCPNLFEMLTPNQSIGKQFSGWRVFGNAVTIKEWTREGRKAGSQENYWVLKKKSGSHGNGDTRYPWVDPGCKSENIAKNFSASSRKSELLFADCSNMNYSEVRDGDALMWGGCSCSLEASAQLCRAKVSLQVQFILMWFHTQQEKEKANVLKLRRRRKLHGWPSSMFNFSTGLKFFRMLVRYLPE